MLDIVLKILFTFSISLFVLIVWAIASECEDPKHDSWGEYLYPWE